MVTIFSDFINEFPNIKIELTSYANYQLYHALEQRMIDIVLGLSFPKYPDYQKILIKKYPLIVLINKNNPLAKRSFQIFYLMLENYTIKTIILSLKGIY